jgi:pseudouridine-5'-phosphate glycosidase
VQTETDTEYLDIAPEVAEALHDGRPVVALESTIISHGMPNPRNVETALRMEAAVRQHGAVPATVAVIRGRLKAGITESEINQLGNKDNHVVKTSRRDLPLVVTRKEDGATTVAATMIVAAMAGIRVFATGGVGGVHRNVAETMDISADLDELARSDVAVVCAGVKSILDIGRTLEYLETRGVPVLGYQTDSMPGFYTTDSGFAVDYRIDSVEDIAAAMKAKWALGLHGGLLIANPIPDAYSLDPSDIDGAIEAALGEMKQKGITGKETTPFLLGKIAELSGGKSLDANVALALNNARLAARIAAAFAS